MPGCGDAKGLAGHGLLDEDVGGVDGAALGACGGRRIAEFEVVSQYPWGSRTRWDC